MDDYEVHSQISRANNRQLLRETLLSYRLLFGQTKAARRKFNKIEKRCAISSDGILDPLLVQLCGTKCSIEETVLDGTAYDKMVYTHEQLPFYHNKLAKLQAYIIAHKTSKIRDRWRNTTDRAEWLAFWALLIVGILSVVSCFVQIALSAAQLQETVQSPGQLRTT